MRGFPKKIATSEDLYNCLGMVQSGELTGSNLATVIANLEQRKYIAVPIVELSEDRKTVVIAECSEAVIGVLVKGSANTKITGIETIESSAETVVEETTQTEPKHATITLSKALPVGETFLRIVSPRDPFVALGITETELNNIKGVLTRYE